jgi:biopolymer transport protein ExbD
MPVAEPNLLPVMNLIVVLIPLILWATKFLNFGFLQYLPPAAQGESAGLPQERLRTELPDLALRINVGEQRFVVGYRVLDRDTSFEIAPNETGRYDFTELSRQLLAIKKNIVGSPAKYADADEVMISALAATDFQTVVSTLDAARDIHVGDHSETLFPLPVLGQLW